ncbi:MAG: acyl-ACP--UDP-N-acetylglucosamine O-acyltransferase [Candidatus Methylumidiphilus sp.]
MTLLIHPTAHIAPGAKLGQNVSVGPFAVIESDVEIGDGCQIGTHAVIHACVRMGQHNIVHPTAVLGGLPQDLGFDPNTVSWVDIGDNNVFREGVTINRATQPGSATRIDSGCYLMNNAHIGHDCQLGNHNILASNVALGGHVQVGKRVFFGGGAVVHQFCRIGSYAMLQGLAGINKDVLPFMMVGGRPGKHYRLNLIGLRRAGIDGDSLKAVSTAIRRLRGKLSLEGLPDTPELEYLRLWLQEGGKRGVLPFVDIHNKDAD